MDDRRRVESPIIPTKMAKYRLHADAKAHGNSATEIEGFNTLEVGKAIREYYTLRHPHLLVSEIHAQKAEGGLLCKVVANPIGAPDRALTDNFFLEQID